MKTLLSAFVVAAACFGASANAGILYLFEETESGIEGTLSGSVDVTGGNLVRAHAYSSGTMSGLFPGFGSVASNVQSTNLDLYEISGRPSYGSVFLSLGTASGDPFSLDRDLDTSLLVTGLPEGYTSGQTLTGSMLLPGVSYAELGVTPGDYLSFLVINGSALQTEDTTITLRFVGEGDPPEVIPLPAGLPLLLAGLGGLMVLRRRKS